MAIKEETEEMKSSRESNLDRLEKKKVNGSSEELAKRKEFTSKMESPANQNKETSFITQVSKETTESKSSGAVVKLVPAPYESQTSHDLSFFLQQNSSQRALISPQIRFVMFQFLFTTVKPMTYEFLTKNVLELIFRKAEIKESRCLEHRTKVEYLYEYGKGCNYFILILSGEATIEVGKEKLEFPAGPFAYFGVNALLCGSETVEQVIQEDQIGPVPSTTPATLAAGGVSTGGAPSPAVSAKLSQEAKPHSSKQYIPDFSLRVDDRCVYLKVDRDLWRSGVIKSRYERLHNHVSETIDIVSSSDRKSEQLESGSRTDEPPPIQMPVKPPKVMNTSDSLTNIRRSTIAASTFDKITQVNKAKMQQQQQQQNLQTSQQQHHQQLQPSPTPSKRDNESIMEESDRTALLTPSDSIRNVSEPKEESNEDHMEEKPFIPKSNE